MSSMRPEETLIDVALRRAADDADRPAFTLLVDGESQEEMRTFGGLDARARCIAGELAQRMAPGDRAVLLYPNGLDYIEAFLGCLYAGVVPVPAYPPSRNHIGAVKRPWPWGTGFIVGRAYVVI